MSDKIEVSKELLDPDKCDFIEKHLSRKECGTCGKAILADSERVWVCMCDLNRPTSWPPTAPPAETTEDAMEDARAFYQKRFPNFPTSDDYTFQILAEFAEQYATKQIERFVEEVETEMLENENITVKV